MRLFRCKHPLAQLVPVSGDYEIRPVNDDFYEKRIHLHCYGCGEDVELRWSQMIGGVDAFIERGMKRNAGVSGMDDGVKP